jgi:acyl-CoA thioesterase FadM
MLEVQLGPDEVGPGIARFDTRYEDLSQNGHVKLTALPTAVGRACFAELWQKHPLAGITREGVVPILSRLAIEIEPVAAKLLGMLEGRGILRFAHERDANDSVRAIFLNTEASIWATPRRSRGGEAGPKQVRVGRVFGDHVFTRLHAPKSERKVLSFNVPGYPALPARRYERPTLEQTVRPNAKAQALESAWSPDVVPWVFGLTHTDCNQHVNSLVYIRLFEDAALRRLAQLGRNTEVLARSVEINYRKPCFAGEQLACMMQTYATRDGDLVVGYIAEPGASIESARCAVRMQFFDPTGIEQRAS